MQRNNRTHTESQHKLTKGHFGETDKVQDVAPTEQEYDTFLHTDIARRLRADNVLLEIVEEWDSLPEHIKSAIKALIDTSK